jgi:ATP-dependent helicase HrpB
MTIPAKSGHILPAYCILFMRKFEPHLPIDELLPEVCNALSQGNLVLSSPPGSGKTTRVPLALLDESWLTGRKIIVLEPRRPAARMAAHHMASLLNQEVGDQVGYQVRFDRKIGPNTRIEVLTEGLLTRRLQQDPELTGVAVVIFDEFHERNLVADLGLALCLDICASLREDLRLLVMSATLDESQVAKLIDGQVVRGDGGLHPVTTHFLAAASRTDTVPVTCRLVSNALLQHQGDVLVFLPGMREMRQVMERLADAPAELMLLHGDIPAAKQQRILLPDKDHARRVILATDIAETSLTIEGVSVVVDSGLGRKPLFDPNTGLIRLQTRRISRASAAQRTGRAGRLGPGDCYRAWTKHQHEQMDAHITPEILQADLSSLVLEAALWGVTDADELRWMNVPPGAHWQQAVELLQGLDALDEQGRISRMGKQMAAMALHPRLAHMLLSAASKDVSMAADVAAILSERDPLRSATGCRSVDLSLRIAALQDYRAGAGNKPYLNKYALQSIQQLSQRLQRQVGKRQSTNDSVSPSALLSLAFPERIAARRSGSDGRFLLASGRGAFLPMNDPLAASDYLAIAHMDAGAREGRIDLALPLGLDDIYRVHGHRIQYRENLYWDLGRQTVAAREEQRLGKLMLQSRPVKPVSEQAAIDVLIDALAGLGMESFHWSKAARQLQARSELMAGLQPESDWPDLSSAWLLEHLDEWLVPWIGNFRSLKQIQALELHKILTSMLNWRQQQQLDHLLPVRWEAANGSSYAIGYEDPESPVLAVPLQEMYGVSETPELANARIRLLLKLLSPAGRPLQITRDLAHFWDHAYKQVQKEMKGRYPKHHWPDDPRHAEPVRLKKHLG